MGQCATMAAPGRKETQVVPFNVLAMKGTSEKCICCCRPRHRPNVMPARPAVVEGRTLFNSLSFTVHLSLVSKVLVLRL